MVAAAESLAEGHDPQWVAHRVGYQTQSGLTRTFTSCTGVTPGRWRWRSRQSSGVEIEAAGAPPLPARSSWRRVNGAHVAVWVARGRATVSIGTRWHRAVRRRRRRAARRRAQYVADRERLAGAPGGLPDRVR
ncbi:hypothetical protein [Gordonia iterans]